MKSPRKIHIIHNTKCYYILAITSNNINKTNRLCSCAIIVWHSTKTEIASIFHWKLRIFNWYFRSWYMVGRAS